MFWMLVFFFNVSSRVFQVSYVRNVLAIKEKQTRMNCITITVIALYRCLKGEHYVYLNLDNHLLMLT